MTNYITPLDAGTDVGDPIAGKLYGRTKLFDAAGTEAIGDVATSPASNTILGRLKAIATALPASLGGKTASASLSVAPASDGFAVTTDAAPASSAAAVVTSDTTVIAGMRALWIGGAGNVVATIGGVDVTFSAVAAGTLLPIKATKIKAASTATLMVSLG